MQSIERGVVIREITVKNPGHMVRMIIEAQTKELNRLIQAEWQNAEGNTIKVTIDPHRYSTTKEDPELSNAAGSKITRLTVQEILPL